MHATITEHREAIAVLCERFHVVRLDVFGSAVTDRFDPATSDVDFLVDFADPTAPSYADNFFGLLRELEKLLGRPVDLLTDRRIRNPYLRRRIEGQTSSDLGALTHPRCCGMRPTPATTSMRSLPASRSMTISIDAIVRAAVKRTLGIVGEALNKLSKIDSATAARITGLPEIGAFATCSCTATPRSMTLWCGRSSKPHSPNFWPRSTRSAFGPRVGVDAPPPSGRSASDRVRQRVFGATAVDLGRCVARCVLRCVLRCVVLPSSSVVTVPGRGGRPRVWLSGADRKRAFRAKRVGAAEPPTFEVALSNGDELAQALKRERLLRQELVAAERTIRVLRREVAAASQQLDRERRRFNWIVEENSYLRAQTDTGDGGERSFSLFDPPLSRAERRRLARSK